MENSSIYLSKIKLINFVHAQVMDQFSRMVSFLNVIASRTFVMEGEGVCPIVFADVTYINVPSAKRLTSDLKWSEK